VYSTVQYSTRPGTTKLDMGGWVNVGLEGGRGME
jgi:hypothetical protein